MIGKVIGGRYEVIEKLGEGGMANVYKAKCKILKRFITIKILKQELTNDEEFVRKFKDEAMEVAKLSDNNIVKVYDIGEEGDLHYIVMEYIDGRTLKEYITDNGVLSIKTALDFSIQICNALVVAHGMELIHRDIKSQNILVSNSGNIKVTDFGIAKSSDSATITNSGKILGSAYYISPEQARGNFVDCRSDIYSFGVVMYEMFTGKLPFTQGTPVSVALQHIQVEPVEPLDIVKKLPIGINNLIIKCLQKNPSLRYNSAKEIREDLVALQNNKKHSVSKYNMLDKTMVIPTVTSKDLHKTVKKDRRKYYKNFIITFVILFVMVISIFLFKGYGIFSKGITVPSTFGKTGVDYERELESLGLKYTVSGYVESDLEENYVVDTFPKPGTSLQKGDTVKIVLSDGPELINVPDITNMTLDRARIALKNSGLILGDIEERYSDVYERGVVMIQNPSANSEVSRGERVSIVISKGSETRLIVVPEFVGLDIVEAKNLANINGININLNPTDTDNKDLDGRVFYQSIPNGIEVKSVSVIDLSYYKYVEKTDNSGKDNKDDKIDDSISDQSTSDKNQDTQINAPDIQQDIDSIEEEDVYDIISTLVLPDLKDMTISEARKTMNSMGLVLDSGDFVDEDIIKQVDHNAGEEVLIGTTIRVESVY